MPSIALLPVRVRFSTLAMAAIVKVTEDSIVSVPAFVPSVMVSVVESTL